MKTFFLTAGHNIINNRGTGAYGIKESNGEQFDEAVEARKLTNDVIAHLKKWYKIEAKTDLDTSTLNQVINWLVSVVKKDDIAIEFHFNAASSASATGTEVIIPRINESKEREYADKLCKVMSEVLLIKNRGVKTELDTAHKSIGILNKPKAATNLLVEVCFITNKRDVQTYRENYWKLVQKLSDTISQFK